MRTHIITSSFRYDGRDKATVFVPHVGFESPGVKAVENVSINFIRTCCELVDGEFMKLTALVELCDYLRCTIGDPGQDDIGDGST